MPELPQGSRKVIYLRRDSAVSADWRSNAQTVLHHLRDDLRHCGTKEGCAEGDCGACMVVVGDLAADGRAVSYRTHNACIMPLSALHGRLLVTVEDIQRGKDELHPVQQALVGCHGSQCGFCTPGFVMSLYEEYIRHPQYRGAEAIHQALSGNLCRCTGYAPISRAARAMYAEPRVLRDEKADLDALATLRHQLESAPDLLGDPIGEWCALPRTLARAGELAHAHPDATLIGGSTDVGLWINKAHKPLRKVIHLSRAVEMRGIEVRPSGIAIGGAVSVADAARAIVTEYPELTELLVRFASPAVRNAATLGGNIANGSPIGDSMPALIALEAVVTLQAGTDQREIPLEELYIAYQKKDMRPGEIVARITVPRRRQGSFVRAYKVSKRHDDDISVVCMVIAARLAGPQLEHLRIAYGGMAEIPKRALHVERALAGAAFNDETVQRAMAGVSLDFRPISDHRGTSWYRERVAKNLLWRAYEEYLGNAETRVLTYGAFA